MTDLYGVTPDMVAATLDKAIEVLHEKGWVRGMLRAQDGRVCAVGALVEAAKLSAPLLYSSEPGQAMQLMNAAERLMHEQLLQRGERFDGVMTWNDYTARDVDEVIEVMKLAREAVSP